MTIQSSNSKRFAAGSAVAASLMLAACGGGGGGGGIASAPTPVPSPTPTPTPTPTPGGSFGTSVSIFPGVSTSTTFASLGVEMKGVNNATTITTTGFAVRYDQAAGGYVLELPSQTAGVFRAGSESSSYWNGGAVVKQGSNTFFWPPTSILKPRADNPLIQLSHTSYAAYLQAGPMEDLPHGYVTFGTVTPAGSVPTVGSATMTALVDGHTENFDKIGGAASLQFNFQNGTLAGWFDPIHYAYIDGAETPLGRYTFTETIFGSGSNAFSGKLSHADTSLTGSFNGLLTGPAADEMMARWSATYRLPGNSSPDAMIGIWVGKRSGN